MKKVAICQYQFDDVTLTCIVEGEGPLVVAVHGFPDSPATFDAQASALVASGFRVARPFLRGYSPSSLSKLKDYGPKALGSDVLNLAQRLAPEQKVRLLGHDWGAVACFAAAALAPERVSHLVTMAVPHARAFMESLVNVNQLRRSWYMAFFQLPWVAESALRRRNGALIERLFRDWSPQLRLTESQMADVKRAVTENPSEVLAYYRALGSPLRWFGPEKRLLLGAVKVPSMHLHGSGDGCIGLSSCAGAERFYRNHYALKEVKGAGHFLTREKPDEVNAALLSFFGQTYAA